MKERYDDSLLAIGREAPSFEAEFYGRSIRYPEDCKGKWIVLFTLPKDFTPSIIHESADFLSLLDEFIKMDIQLIGLCVDSIYRYIACLDVRKQMTESARKSCDEKIFVIEDVDQRISGKFFMNISNEQIESVVIIDRERKIRCQLNYANSTWKNFREIKHIILALQKSDKVISAY